MENYFPICVKKYVYIHLCTLCSTASLNLTNGASGSTAFVNLVFFLQFGEFVVLENRRWCNKDFT